MLALLQHPVEARRVYAAETASLLDAASTAVVSALLSSRSGLSTLLTRLSGDDTPEARSSYAKLIACCVAHCDAAALKQISDSGAVPYLLKLLREVDGWGPQYHVVGCLEVPFPPVPAAKLLQLCVNVCSRAAPLCVPLDAASGWLTANMMNQGCS